MRRTALALLCLLMLAGCGTLRPAKAPPGSHTAAGNRAAARADAGHLLGLVILPQGAIRSSSGLGGQPVLTTASPNLVDRRASWRVKGTMAGVFAFIEEHPPREAKATGNGSSSALRGAIMGEDVVFSWPPVKGVLGKRSLVVEVAPLSHGYAGVRADAEVIWLNLKPAGERVPPQARGLTVTRGWAGRRPSLSFTTSNAAEVDRIAAMLDRLPIIQPGMVNCPMIPVAPTVTFTLRARKGGPALAQASTLASGPHGECPGIGFKVRGHPPLGLSAWPAFLQQAQRALGVHLMTK